MQEVLPDKLNIQDDIEFDHISYVTILEIGEDLLFKDKQKILQNAKKLNNTGIYIYEDFLKGTMELRKSLWEEFLNCHRLGKFTYLKYKSVVVRDDS